MLTSCSAADQAGGNGRGAANSQQQTGGSTTATAGAVSSTPQAPSDYITLTNNKGMTVVVLPLGAVIQRLIVPDRYARVFHCSLHCAVVDHPLMRGNHIKHIRTAIVA